MIRPVSPEALDRYRIDGYVPLGDVVTNTELYLIRDIADDVLRSDPVLGSARYDMVSRRGTCTLRIADTMASGHCLHACWLVLWFSMYMDCAG
jgi:hypothetical protein